MLHQLCLAAAGAVGVRGTDAGRGVVAVGGCVFPVECVHCLCIRIEHVGQPGKCVTYNEPMRWRAPHTPGDHCSGECSSPRGVLCWACAMSSTPI